MSVVDLAGVRRRLIVRVRLYNDKDGSFIEENFFTQRLLEGEIIFSGGSRFVVTHIGLLQVDPKRNVLCQPVAVQLSS